MAVRRSPDFGVYATCLLVCALFSPRLAGAAGSEYYPLAKGFRWTYSVSKLGVPKPTSVIWIVTESSTDERGSVFQVWPTPPQSDDDAVELLETSDGVKLRRDDCYILKNPIGVGDQWNCDYENARVHKQVRRSFKVVSVGKSCRVGKFSFEDCAIVEENDEGLNLQAVTMYARGVGPVEYRYHRADSAAKNREPIQTVAIISYKLASREGAPR